MLLHSKLLPFFFRLFSQGKGLNHKRTKVLKTRITRLATIVSLLTAPFSNMRTLKFKARARPTNTFFATVNYMLGYSSQLPTSAERPVIKSNRRAQFRQHSRKLGGAAEHLIDGSEKSICRLSFEFKALIKRRMIVDDS